MAANTGFIGSPDLTDTGGWVWMIVGVGDDVVVEQLDPASLGVHRTESLLVKDNLDGEPQINPVLTATVDGPLWVAGGEDLWGAQPFNRGGRDRVRHRQLDWLDVNRPCGRPPVYGWTGECGGE